MRCGAARRRRSRAGRPGIADGADHTQEEAGHEQAAERALYTYLSPYTGGPDGRGWPVGRDLHVSEIYARLQRVASVEYVDEVKVSIEDPAKPGTSLTVSPRLADLGRGRLKVTSSATGPENGQGQFSVFERS